MQAMALPRRLGRDVMLMLSHAGDGVDKATWPLRDVGADDHANVTPGLICIKILGKEKTIK
jgi:hypothetical protein